MPSNTTCRTWNSREGKQRLENKAFVLLIYLKLPNMVIRCNPKCGRIPLPPPLRHTHVIILIDVCMYFLLGGWVWQRWYSRPEQGNTSTHSFLICLWYSLVKQLKRSVQKWPQWQFLVIFQNTGKFRVFFHSYTVF